MALDFNDPDLEFSDLVYAYQSWVMAVINDEKLGGDKLLTDEIADDALHAMRLDRQDDEILLPQRARVIRHARPHEVDLARLPQLQGIIPTPSRR